MVQDLLLVEVFDVTNSTGGNFYYYSKNNIKYNFIHYLLITFSVFSIFSTIFFETTSQTQLSLTKTINSYGSNALYVQRNFLTGYVESIFTLRGLLQNFYNKLFRFNNF